MVVTKFNQDRQNGKSSNTCVISIPCSEDLKAVLPGEFSVDGSFQEAVIHVPAFGLIVGHTPTFAPRPINLLTPRLVQPQRL